MVRRRRQGLAAGRPAFVVAEPFEVGATCALDEQAAHHARVLRLEPGAVIGLRDGAGRVGEARLVRVTRQQLLAEVTRVSEVPPLPPVHLLVPVADRDRLLWLAEKAAELGCTSWRPVLWRRSRSVAPRGEGMGFQAKVRARMAAALAQAEQAWLPQLFPEATLERALLAAPAGDRIVADPDGAPLVAPGTVALRPPVVVAVGPEGGLEADELAASLGPGILRFETAAVAALAMVRTLLAGEPLPSTDSPNPPVP